MKNLLLLSLTFSFLSFAGPGKVDQQIKKEFSGEFTTFNAKTIEVQKAQAKARFEKISGFEKKLYEDRIKMLDAVLKEISKLKMGEVKANREIRKSITKIRNNFQKEVRHRRAEFRKSNKETAEENRKIQKARHVEFKKKVQVRRDELKEKK